MIDGPAVCVRPDEVVLLVMGFLRDEGGQFPATRKAFEEEAAHVLQAIKPKKRNVKTLHAILEEYLELKMEKEQRMELASNFGNDPDAATKVESVMENIKTLLDDYKVMRDSTFRPAQPELRGLDGSCREKRHAPDTPSNHTNTSTESLAGAETTSPSAEPQGAPATHSSPERKRRKGVPVHNCRSPLSANKSRSRTNGSRAQLQAPDSVAEESGVVKQDPAEAAACYPLTGTDGIPLNIYSDISESVLSDPQVSQLLEDSENVDDLFGILGDTDFSKLVQPLTHHINAKLAGEASDFLAKELAEISPRLSLPPPLLPPSPRRLPYTPPSPPLPPSLPPAPRDQTRTTARLRKGRRRPGLRQR